MEITVSGTTVSLRHVIACPRGDLQTMIVRSVKRLLHQHLCTSS